jgi:hypothetical protein
MQTFVLRFATVPKKPPSLEHRMFGHFRLPKNARKNFGYRWARVRTPIMNAAQRATKLLPQPRFPSKLPGGVRTAATENPIATYQSELPALACSEW